MLQCLSAKKYIIRFKVNKCVTSNSHVNLMQLQDLFTQKLKLSIHSPSCHAVEHKYMKMLVHFSIQWQRIVIHFQAF